MKISSVWSFGSRRTVIYKISGRRKSKESNGETRIERRIYGIKSHISQAALIWPAYGEGSRVLLKKSKSLNNYFCLNQSSAFLKGEIYCVIFLSFTANDNFLRFPKFYKYSFSGKHLFLCHYFNVLQCHYTVIIFTLQYPCMSYERNDTLL